MARVKPIYFKGRKLGEIHYDENVYISERTYRDHYFYIHDGYGISLWVLDILQGEGIDKVRFYILDKKEVLQAQTAQFLVNGIDWTDFTFGKKDEQLVLPLNFFNKKVSSTQQMRLGLYS